MITPDFSERTYTAEVIKLTTDASEAVKIIMGLSVGPRSKSEIEGIADTSVKVYHSFIASKRQYHRYPRSVATIGNKFIEVPRRMTVRGNDCFLYDILIAQSKNQIIVAVPFHDLAEEFFVRVDRALAGKGSRYEKLDIRTLAIKLGLSGEKTIANSTSADKVSICVTRCHLSYSDPEGRTTNLKQIQITGTNIGTTPEYKSLILPVLATQKDVNTVTPIVLGFGLLVNDVKKSSATTDLHGNFKVWIAPGLRRLTRLFALLDTIETMKEVTSTTSNVPILQSKTIRGAED